MTNKHNIDENLIDFINLCTIQFGCHFLLCVVILVLNLTVHYAWESVVSRIGLFSK